MGRSGHYYFKYSQYGASQKQRHIWGRSAEDAHFKYVDHGRWANKPIKAFENSSSVYEIITHYADTAFQHCITIAAWMSRAAVIT